MTQQGRPSLGCLLLSRVLLGILFKLAVAIGSSAISVLRNLPVDRVWDDIEIGLFVTAAIFAGLGAWEYRTGRDLFPQLLRCARSSRSVG